MSLFVAYYGDGPYWDNTILLAAYPTGYSYFRPFRYRDDWIEPKLLEETISKPASLVGRRGTLGIRFRDPGSHERIVPLREVTVASVEREDDSFVYFKLGRFFEIPPNMSLADFSRALPSADGSPHDFLFFEANVDLPPLAAVTRDTEMWGRFGTLVESETNLPIRAEAKQGVFVHFKTPTADAPADVGEIDTSKASGAKFGASIPEQAKYELVVLHRIPRLIGSNGSIEPITATVNTTNFEVAPRRISVSGNYGRNVLTVTARRASAVWEDISLEPDKSEETSAAGEAIRLVPLSIPVRGTANWIYRAKSHWFPLLLIGVAFGINGVVGGWDVISDHPILWMLVFLSAIAASGAVLKIRE